MHTIVIRIGKKYEDWHLIEPLFYKLEERKKLIFFWEEEASASKPLFLTLVDRIIEHIERHKVLNWQLFFLTSSNDERSRQYRFATQLVDLKKNLLMPLKAKGFHPQNVVMHMIDIIQRNPDYSPPQEILKMYWELDNHGYRISDCHTQGNTFMWEEIKALDEKWGEKVSLQDAGILDKPNSEFIQNLSSKCDRVVIHLTELIERKKSQLDQKDLGGDDWLSTDQLNAVLMDFTSKLKKLCTPPLTPLLTSFKPSLELANILKYHVGLVSEMEEIRMVRQEIYMGSHRERLKGYIELAYFLITISHHPKLIDRIDKGSSSAIQVTLNEEGLEQLLSNYYFSLVSMKKKIEDRLIVENQFHTNRLREEDFKNYVGTKSIKAINDFETASIPFNQATFYDTLENEMYQVDKTLENREKELISASKEAIRNLAILKRNKQFILEEEKVEINEYLEELKNDISETQHKVISSAPSLSKALERWRIYTKEAKDKMHHQLQRLPSVQQVGMAFLFIYVTLLLPFLLTIDSHLITKTWEQYYYYLLFPVGLLFLLLIPFLYARKLSMQPLLELKERSEQMALEMYQIQEESQHKYNAYINQLYRLFSLKKYYQKVDEEGEEKKALNILLRYHQVKLEEYVQSTIRLLRILQINVETKNSNTEPYNYEMKEELDVMRNPVYTPFSEQSPLNESGNGINVLIGSAKEQYESMYFDELEKIRILDDKVYKV
ncbi:hypothetical protein IM538_19165 [Cytobacillus suaedae]|nr:hypothetical protein IM538_19165 [Cytobacillus suaedae]